MQWIGVRNDIYIRPEWIYVHADLGDLGLYL